MLLTAQYSNHMRIGQGYNSFTSETRIDGAVSVDEKHMEPTSPPPNWRDSAIEMTSPSPSTAGAQEPMSKPDLESGGAIPGKKPASVAKLIRNASPDNVVSKKAEPQNKAPSTAGLATLANPPFQLSQPHTWKNNQNVTYSSWQIDHVSEIADALNISSYALVKYATVEANANAAMIHESRLHDSQLNYMVSVKVSNESESSQEPMQFQPIENLPPEKFAQAYGDCFISDFLEGGEFSAVISIKVNDKSKLQQVKEAVDVQLSVPAAPGLEVGAGNKYQSSKASAFENTETTISVKSNGGGVIKTPGAKWNLDTVAAVASAFPSMVAACPAKTSAVLTKYTSLKSFQEWKYRMAKDPSWNSFVNQDDHWENRLIPSYVPCKIYTAALFEDLMVFKHIQRRVKDIMANPTHYKTKEQTKEELEAKQAESATTPSTITETDPSPSISRKQTRIEVKRSLSRGNTFGLEDPDNPGYLNVRAIDNAKEPLPVDIAALKDVKYVCRSAITLITEETARLVDHPALGYAEYESGCRRIQFNRPNYPLPELLERRLPMFVGNDASEDTLSHDEAVLMTRKHAHDNDLYFNLAGDIPHPHRTYKDFTSLDVSEPDPRSSTVNRVTHLSIHAYQHRWWKPSAFSKDSHLGIGAIGLTFSKTPGNQVKRSGADGCKFHFGGRPSMQPAHFRVADLISREGASEQEISQIEIYYVPGSGRIAKITFHGSVAGFGDQAMQALSWTQWEHDESDGMEPEGLKKVVQSPPRDGSRWQFAGLCGCFDSSMCGMVLARVSGVWRRI